MGLANSDQPKDPEGRNETTRQAKGQRVRMVIRQEKESRSNFASALTVVGAITLNHVGTFMHAVIVGKEAIEQ